MSWANDLNRLTTKGGKDLGKLVRTIKLSVFTGIVKETRVDTGRLKGNWQISENSPASGDLSRLDPNGSAAISDINAGVNENGLTYLTNNLPYAAVYEEKDAMVARNVARVKANIKAMAKKVKG